MELSAELEELGEAVAAGEVGGDVDLAVCVSDGVDGVEGAVGGDVLEVEPLHLGGVGAVVEDGLDTCV